MRATLRDHGLDAVDSARLFAAENLAAADVAIGRWNDKYHWNFWRPITAIREDQERPYVYRFSDALTENINARVWAGIHFRTADVQGAALGEKVARYLRKHYLQPVH
jgi:hypothetical protein